MIAFYLPTLIAGPISQLTLEPGRRQLRAVDFSTEANDSPTVTVARTQACDLVERLASSYYFAYEMWFPTDPRPYEIEANGNRVVGGFGAFNGCHERNDTSASPLDRSCAPTLWSTTVRRLRWYSFGNTWCLTSPARISTGVTGKIPTSLSTLRSGNPSVTSRARTTPGPQDRVPGS